MTFIRSLSSITLISILTLNSDVAMSKDSEQILIPTSSTQIDTLKTRSAVAQNTYQDRIWPSIKALA